MGSFFLRRCTAFAAFALVVLVAAHLLAAGDQLYWTEQSGSGTNKVCHSNLDGTNRTVIAEGSNGNVGPLPYYFLPTGIGVDMSAGYVYWADTNGNKVTRAALDGSNQTTVGTSTDPYALLVDPTGGHIYWSDTTENKIYRANLDGSQSQAIVTSGILFVEGLALDSVHQKLYWTDIHTDTIKRANVDGTNIETLVSGQGLQAASGLALDLSHGRMYWADWATHKIQRANLDGSSVENFVTSGLSYPNSLALDPASSSLYCLDFGMTDILRIDLGTRSVTHLFAAGAISSGSCIAYAQVPEPSACVLAFVGLAVFLACHRLRRYAWHIDRLCNREDTSAHGHRFS
jgi:sugar lactone lactonase YvrE